LEFLAAEKVIQSISTELLSYLSAGELQFLPGSDDLCDALMHMSACSPFLSIFIFISKLIR